MEKNAHAAESGAESGNKRQMTKSAHQYVKITESAHISYLITGSAFRDFKIVITTIS